MICPNYSFKESPSVLGLQGSEKKQLTWPLLSSVTFGAGREDSTPLLNLFFNGVKYR